LGLGIYFGLIVPNRNKTNNNNGTTWSVDG
jgi:hypothetical protein